MFRYQCSDCGYSAKVSGDYDRGFERYQVTSFCESCKEILDVPIPAELWRANCRGGLLTNPDVNCPRTHPIIASLGTVSARSVRVQWSAAPS